MAIAERLFRPGGYKKCGVLLSYLEPEARHRARCSTAPIRSQAA